MIYLYVNGNCGNQFFQYAFAKVVAKKTGDRIAVCWLNKEDMKKRNQLQYFHVDIAQNIPEHRKALPRTLYYKMRTLLYKNTADYDKFDYRFARFFEKLGVYSLYHGYYPFHIKKHKNAYITGYFESSKYFNSIKKEIQRQFTPTHDKLEHNQKLYEKIAQTESVCVTIRRGDFLSDQYRKKFFVCDENYFYNAVKVMKQKKKNIVLFIFSDDVEWVRTHMDFGEVETYYERGDDPIWEKIRMMYSCKNFIISNSSFSWWAQYLSRNEKKTVIAPDIWRREDPKAKDIYEDNWILLKTGD